MVRFPKSISFILKPSPYLSQTQISPDSTSPFLLLSNTEREKEMKRSLNNPQQEQQEDEDHALKKSKTGSGTETELSHLNGDMLFEILKFVDSTTLGKAACVNKKWQKVSNDDRLWEIICTRHWEDIGCPHEQVRCVVNAFGGFRLLHSLYLRPLLKLKARTESQHSSSATVPAKWGKDEVHLSLGLYSIRAYEKMDCNFELLKKKNYKIESSYRI